MTCRCGKIQHATREVALQHQTALVFKHHVAKQPERSKGLHVYPCPDSDVWHVGHALDVVPLVYHYTVGYKLDAILQANALRPRHPKARTLAVKEPKPLLWFSWNQTWEQSVTKDPRPPNAVPPTGRAITELSGDGLLRFGAPASVAKLRWNDYLAMNATPVVHREAMAQRGKPFEWLGTDQRVPLAECCAFEVYYRGRWTDGASVPDADFAQYLAERPVVYADAWVRLATKVRADTSHNHPMAVLDAIQPEDDAEAILLDDYRAWVREENWRRAHRDEIREWQTTLRVPAARRR